MMKNSNTNTNHLKYLQYNQMMPVKGSNVKKIKFNINNIMRAVCIILQKITVISFPNIKCTSI